MLKYFWLYLKGIAMGTADVIPGVSGGTIAFITGIYEQLIDAINSVNIDAVKTLFSKGPMAAWQQINGNFLLVLVLGIGSAIFTFAKLISHLLTTYPTFVWAFFFGLIVAGSWHMIKQIPEWNPRRWIALFVGALMVAGISVSTPSELVLTSHTVFFGGCIAICAMILPGISGSFLLLLMGLYGPILSAVKNLEFDVIAIFLSGAVVGILLFTRLLSWLLHHYKFLMYALLTGFMLGALLKVWPWKTAHSFRSNRHGEQVPVVEYPSLPDLSELSSVLIAIGFILLGFGLVILMEKWSLKNIDTNNGND